MRIKNFTILTLALLMMSVVAVAQKSFKNNPEPAYLPITTLQHKINGLDRKAQPVQNVNRRAGGELVTPPADATVERWNLTGSSLFALYSGGWVDATAKMTPIHVAIYNDDVYIQGLAYYFSEAWIKGTISGTTVSFPTETYIGSDNWGDEYMVGSTDGNTTTAFTMTYDALNKSLVLDSGYLLIEADLSNGIGAYGYWPALELNGPIDSQYNFDDHTMQGWTTIDANNDGFDWVLGSQANGVYTVADSDLTGQGSNGSADFVTSGSFSNIAGVLYPDNYLVSPKVKLGGKIKFSASAQDRSYPAEYFGVAVSTAGNTDPADFTMLENWTMTAAPAMSPRRAQGKWYKYEVDLSDYLGQEGYVAIRHYNCSDQFMLNIDDITIDEPAGPEDIEISPESGDISTALATAVEGKVVKNITINLTEGAEYTVSASIVAPASVTINGNGATIDASGLTDAFIKMSSVPAVEVVGSGQYVIMTETKIDNVKITGLTKALFADNGKPYAFDHFTISNSVFNYKTQSNVVLNFAASMAINFDINNSTFYSETPGTANFIALSGKRPWQITGYGEDAQGKFTADHNTFYNVAKSKQFLNTNTLKGQNRYKYEMNSNIFVDVSNKKIYGNMTNNKNQVTTDGKNTYMFDDQFFAETNYNGDEGLTTDPGFKDAPNGDFTLAATSDQNINKTGDPRWIPTAYAVNIADGIENGSVVPDKTTAYEGEEVTLTISPDDYYELDAISVTGVTSDIAVIVTDGKFTMPADDVTVNATFKKLSAEDITIAAADITDGDITAAVNAASEGKLVGNITLTLASGDYTLSEPISATGSVTISGAGAGNSDTSNATVIDASGLSGAGFISYTEILGEKAKKDDGTDSPYTIVQNVKIVGVNIKGLSKPIVNNTVSKVLFKTLIVDNSVIEIVGNSNVFNLGVSYAEVCNITKSTIWSKAGQKNFFFKADGKPADISSTATTTWTVDQCDLYNIAVEKKANNSNGGIKGKKTTTMVLKNSILYNFGSSKGNEVNGWLWGQNGGANAEYGNNTYWSADGEVTGWTDASKGGSDQSGTSVVCDPAFADAANGDFTVGDKAQQQLSRTGDPRWLSAYKPDGFTAPIEISPLDGADLAEAYAEAQALSLSPAYIKITLRPGAHYTVSAPLDVNTSITITGDAENPATVDLKDLNSPLVRLSSILLPAVDADENGFYHGSYPYNVIFENTIFSEVNNSLFAGQGQMYIIDYLTVDNCIVEYINSNKTIFDFAGVDGKSPVVERFTISNSTLYSKEKHNGFLYSSQSGKKITEAGRAMQYFTVNNSTFYGIATGKNLTTGKHQGQKTSSYTIKENVVINSGKSGQFVVGWNGGQQSANPTWLVQYNSFMSLADGKLADVDEKSTGDQYEDISGTYKNIYPEMETTAIFPKWFTQDLYGNYTDTFRGNFTVADGSVQKTNAIGDPRWLKSDNEYTGIEGVATEKAADECAWYTIQGVRVEAPTKGLYIHNGKTVIVK